MTKVFFIAYFFFGACFFSYAQEGINDYKYVIVPNQYNFLSEPDQFQLNGLTKFLFNKYGFTTFLQGEELPEDLEKNRCLALYADAEKISAFLKTKIQIQLTNCDGKVIFVSKEGETREKEYYKAYNLALRDAFESFQSVNYKYKPNNKVLSKTETKPNSIDSNSKSEIQRLQEEIKELKEEKSLEIEPKIALEKDVKTETVTTHVSKKIETTGSTVVSKTNSQDDLNLLYAQPIDNGFEIVDTTPKKIMVLYYSSMKDVFIVKGKDAIIYKKGDLWMYSENDGTQLKVEAINIKF